MQKWQREIQLLIASLSTLILVQLLPLNESRVAILQLENSLRQNLTFQMLLRRECESLFPVRTSSAEERLAKAFAGHLLPNATGPLLVKRCYLQLNSESNRRLYLRSHWSYLLQLKLEGKEEPLLTQSLHVEFPTLLAVVPLLILSLSLLFRVRWITWTWLVFGYLFLAGGGSPYLVTQLLVQSTRSALEGDSTLWGLTCLLLFVFLKQSHLAYLKINPVSVRSRNDTWAADLTHTLAALWNPMTFALVARLVFPFRVVGETLSRLITEQTLLCAVSLYFLKLDGKPFQNWLHQGLLLPRYFTLSLILFSAARLFTLKRPAQSPPYRWPRFGLNLLFVILVEIIHFLFLKKLHLPFLTRAGIALLLSEIRPLSQFQFKPGSAVFARTLFVLLLSSLLPSFCHRSGLASLSISIWDPRVHPHSFALFTFLSALMLSLWTGSISFSLLTLLPLANSPENAALIRGSLIDGILVGSVLSPFSLHNLLPATLFSQDIKTILTERIRQIRSPFFIALAVYAISLFQSVSIVRPLFFSFLCLSAVSLQLKRWKWRVPIARGRFALTGHSAQHSRA